VRKVNEENVGVEGLLHEGGKTGRRKEEGERRDGGLGRTEKSKGRVNIGRYVDLREGRKEDGHKRKEKSCVLRNRKMSKKKKREE